MTPHPKSVRVSGRSWRDGQWLDVYVDDRDRTYYCPEGAWEQMTIDQCIEIAERECVDGPCPCRAECDEAGTCLTLDRYEP